MPVRSRVVHASTGCTGSSRSHIDKCVVMSRTAARVSIPSEVCVRCVAGRGCGPMAARSPAGRPARRSPALMAAVCPVISRQRRCRRRAPWGACATGPVYRGRGATGPARLRGRRSRNPRRPGRSGRRSVAPHTQVVLECLQHRHAVASRRPGHPAGRQRRRRRSPSAGSAMALRRCPRKRC